MAKSDSVDGKDITDVKSENNFVSSSVENPKPTNKWMIATYIFAVIALIFILLFVSDKLGITGNVVAEDEMEVKITSFLDNELLPGGGAVLNSLEKQSGVYVATVTASGQEVPLYFTLDGNFISPGRELYPISLDNAESENIDSAPKNITKSDKPTVELFIMTHCPYGTQAEKGILPVIDLLKDKASINIKFVHYFMHGDEEEEETYRQICIRQEQSAKFNTYLSCFLEAGDSAGCLTKTGINSASLKVCMDTNAKKYYEIDSQASKSYGVQGSPTMVVNGVQADFYPRSPANALDIICSAFKTEPSECSTSTLSTANPSPGFGSGTTAANTDASC